MLTKDAIAEFLNNEHKDIWALISVNNIEALLQLLQPVEEPQRFMDKVLRKKKVYQPQGDLYIILAELFNSGKSPTLENELFKLDDSNKVGLFTDLIRLLFALEANGKHDEVKSVVAVRLWNATGDIAGEIQVKASGYPLNPISGAVWFAGSEMRNALHFLSFYCKKNKRQDAQLWVERNRTRTTLSIMAHYKAIVGPDMIRVAELQERMELPDDAIVNYEAVIGDFKDEIAYNIEDREVGKPPLDEEIVILTSLLKSYKGVNRIKQTDNYVQEMQVIEALLKS
jgi:hypothetical protein